MDLNERVASLEAQEKNVFHQLDEIKEDVKDIRRLTVAVEKIAEQTNTTAEQVHGINSRLDTLEHAPVADARHYKRIVISSIITGIVGVLLGAVLSLILK